MEEDAPCREEGGSQARVLMWAAFDFIGWIVVIHAREESFGLNRGHNSYIFNAIIHATWAAGPEGATDFSSCELFALPASAISISFKCAL